MIYWIFGGTAVGKKRFISQCLDPETRPEFIHVGDDPVRAEWIPDGPVEADVVRLSEESHIFIRWQWGREEHLTNILKDHPEVDNCIVILTCSLIAQLSRVALREGCLKWDAEILHGEQRAIYECVYKISEQFWIPVLFVDCNGEYQLR